MMVPKLTQNWVMFFRSKVQLWENVHEISEIEVFLDRILILQSGFLLGVWQMFMMYAEKNTKNL